MPTTTKEDRYNLNFFTRPVTGRRKQLETKRKEEPDTSARRSLRNHGSGSLTTDEEALKKARERRERMERVRARAERVREHSVRESGNFIPVLSDDDRKLLSNLTAALQEHTDTLREVHDLSPIDRTEPQAEAEAEEAPEEGAEEEPSEGEEAPEEASDED